MRVSLFRPWASLFVFLEYLAVEYVRAGEALRRLDVLAKGEE